jgi:hypothetical protein
MHNPGLWDQVDRAGFDMVLASPEVLLRDGSHFWLKTIWTKSNPFCTRLKAVAVDESHLKRSAANSGESSRASKRHQLDN